MLGKSFQSKCFAEIIVLWHLPRRVAACTATDTGKSPYVGMGSPTRVTFNRSFGSMERTEIVFDPAFTAYKY